MLVFRTRVCLRGRGEVCHEKLESDILKILQEDCRVSAAEVAVMLGREEAEVAAAIAEMERRGAIVKYTAILNSEAMEDELVQALIEVRVSPQKSSGFDAIAEEIYRCEEVTSCYLMSGGFDLAVFIEGKSLREVARFVSERLSTLDDVLSTATHFILKKYKIEGTITDKEDENRVRLSVQA